VKRRLASPYVAGKLPGALGRIWRASSCSLLGLIVYPEHGCRIFLRNSVNFYRTTRRHIPSEPPRHQYTVRMCVRNSDISLGKWHIGDFSRYESVTWQRKKILSVHVRVTVRISSVLLLSDYYNRDVRARHIVSGQVTAYVAVVLCCLHSDLSSVSLLFLVLITASRLWQGISRQDCQEENVTPLLLALSVQKVVWLTGDTSPRILNLVIRSQVRILLRYFLLASVPSH
jgi:hypothetical protein